jgi:hypothetical protein
MNLRIVNKVLKHNLSTNQPVDKLDPSWVTGFVDAEGCFSIIIEITNPLKWKVRTSFERNLHEKDAEILYKIKSFFWCRCCIAQHSKDIELLKFFIKFFDYGVVNLRSNLSTPRCDFIVQDVTSLLNKIIPHFNLYPLLNLKQEDSNCFREAILMVKLKRLLIK